MLFTPVPNTEIPLSSTPNVKPETLADFIKLLHAQIIRNAFSRKRNSINGKPPGSLYRKHWPKLKHVGIDFFISPSLSTLKEQFWSDQEKWLNTTDITNEAYGQGQWRHCSLYLCTKNLKMDSTLLFNLMEQCMLNEELNWFSCFVIFRKDGDLYVTDLFSKIYRFDLGNLIPIVIRFEEGEDFDNSVYDSLLSTIDHFIESVDDDDDRQNV